MITLLGRTLDIPVSDRVIGQQGDCLVEIRQFKITDPSLFSLSFKLDTETSAGKDIYDLKKAQEDDCIILTWTVTNLHTRVSGDIRVQLRGFDNSGCVWHSYCDYFCVNDSIYTTEDFAALSPTEFEEIEQRITGIQKVCEQYAASAASEAEKVAEGKADADLSNVSDADFKAKFSKAFPGGEVGGDAGTYIVNATALWQMDYNIDAVVPYEILSISDNRTSILEALEAGKQIMIKISEYHYDAHFMFLPVTCVLTDTIVFGGTYCDTFFEVEYHSDNTVTLSYKDLITKEELDTATGDIDTALDNIIAIQNAYIGGETE